jgi:hypothetical protein
MSEPFELGSYPLEQVFAHAPEDYRVEVTHFPADAPHVRGGQTLDR